MLDKCEECGGDPIQHMHMLQVVCSGCGVATPSMQGTRGDFQSEHDAAGFYWNKAMRERREIKRTATEGSKNGGNGK
jgi:hypothetical protein